jgi:hypothetical protein
MRTQCFKKNKLKPWLKKEYCIPPKQNAAFVCQMEEVLDVYCRPYDANYPLVCMDETSKQLTKEVRTPIQSSPGNVERFDSEYERNGTSNIFIAYEPLVGKRITKTTERRTQIDWAEFIKELVDKHYKNATKIVLVMDNLNTHSKTSLYEAFEPSVAKRIADKLEIHFTPKHGSWLNMAEIELSHLSRQCLDRRIPDRVGLSKEIAGWNEQRDQQNTKTIWHFTTDDARIKLKKLYPAF